MQLDPISTMFNVSEQDVLWVRTALAKRGLKPAEPGTIPLEVGLMNEDGYPHGSVIDYVAPMVDTSTGTLMARGLLPNTDRTLLRHVSAHPRPVEQTEALLVPDIALGADQSDTYVLVVDRNNVAQQRSVKTGQLVGKLRVIETGIAADDLAVVAGTQKAIPGEKVAPQPTSITADSSATPSKS